MADIIGVSPAPVRLCGKERPIPWHIEKNDHYFYLSIETIQPDPTKDKTYTCQEARLLESLKWILPRFEKITNIHILDACKKYLLVEMHWRVDTQNFIKPKDRQRKLSLPRSANTTNGVWKLYRNRLPERILMNCDKNKQLYKKLCNYDYKTWASRNKEHKKSKDVFIKKGKKLGG